VQYIKKGVFADSFFTNFPFYITTTGSNLKFLRVDGIDFPRKYIRIHLKPGSQQKISMMLIPEALEMRVVSGASSQIIQTKPA
jgi:hypothetical protein